MKFNTTKFCYLRPRFPQNSFVVMLFLLEQDKVYNILPKYPAFTTLEQATHSIQDSVDVIKKKQTAISIADACILLPLKFASNIPLKPEYWTNPSVAYTPVNRASMFLPLHDNYKDYKILVTPGEFDEKQDLWELNALLPIKNGTPKKALEQFMLSSDTYVNHRAKYAALYAVNAPQRFLWKTGKIELNENEN